MSNYLKTFSGRINESESNIAEIKSEEYYKSKDFKIFRFGFDLLREGIDVNSWCKIPILIRKKPDYIVVKKNAYFIEAKGCINVIRLKEEDINAYGWWQDKLKMSLGFFFYSTSYKNYITISYNDVLKYLPQCEKGKFADNGKTYYKVYFESLEKYKRRRVQ